MTRAEIIKEIKILQELERRKPVWTPQKTNEPQKAAFECDADEIGYGGAAGGGKTFLGIMMAMYKHWHTYIFRKNLDDHGALLEIIKDHEPESVIGVPPIYRPKQRKKVVAKKIQFAYLKHENDLGKHQGKAKDLLWFDEAVHFGRADITRLSAHLRPLQPDVFDKSGLKCQLLLTFNPPLDTIGLWVIDMFAPWIDERHPLFPLPSGQIMYCAYLDDIDYFFDKPDDLTHHPKTGKKLDDPIILKSRTFFRATLDDNEALRNDRSYRAKLQSLSEVERRAFLYGEMSASLVDAAGQIVKRKNWIEAEKRWEAKEALHKGTPPLCISIDVTGGGEDRFVCMPFWKGGHAGMPVHEKGNLLPRASDQCDFVTKYIQDTFHVEPDSIVIVYDSGGGYGDAFRDEWLRRFPEAEMYAFSGGSGAKINGIFGDPEMNKTIGEISGMPFVSGSNKFPNTISAAWARAGQMLEHELFEISVPPHRELSRQAQARVFAERVGKHLAIESKKDLAKRLKCSPDFADAWVMGLHWMSSEIAVVDQFSKK